MTDEQKWNEAQLPIDIRGPLPSVWWPADGNGSFEQVTEMYYLARNTRYITRALRELVRNGSYELLFYPDMSTSRAPPGAKLQCGIRLVRLLHYYLHVCRVCLKDVRSKYDQQTIAGGLVKLLDTYTAWIGCHLERMPSSWTNNLPDPLNEKYGPFNEHEQPYIPGEPMLELLAQVFIWVQTQQPQAEVQNLQTEDGVQSLLRSMMSVWPTETVLAKDIDRTGMSLCLFAAQLKTAGTFATANLVVGCTVARYPEKIGPYFDKARMLRLRGADPANSNRRFDLQLMAKWQEPPPDPENDTDEVVATSINQEYMKAVRHAASQKLYDKVKTFVNGRLKPSDWLPDARFQKWNALTITQMTRYILRDGDPLNRPLPPLPPTANWSPFDWTNMTARSHFVMPGTVAGQTDWFDPVPRCSKCRTIHDYIIQSETDIALLNYNEINRPLGCAEDIIHCKLRLLYPDDRAGEGKGPRKVPDTSADNVGPNLSWYFGLAPVAGKKIHYNGTWTKGEGRVTKDSTTGEYDVQFADGTSMSGHKASGLLMSLSERFAAISSKKKEQMSAMAKEKKEQEKEEKKENKDGDDDGGFGAGGLFGDDS